MIEIIYIKDTITTLERATQEETLIDLDDYQKICLQVLRCEKLIQDSPTLQDRIKTELAWFGELTELFYAKMLVDLREDDE